MKINEMARAADESVRRSLKASCASRLVKNFKLSIIKLFLALVCDVAVEQGIILPSTKVRLT